MPRLSAIIPTSFFARNCVLRSLLVAICLFEPVSIYAQDNPVAGSYPAIELLGTTSDVLGRALEYPDCAPAMRAVIITLAPGQAGGDHQHLTPVFGYILEGEISVDYEADGGVTKIYREGEALMEAMHVMHHGYNATAKPSRLLALFMNCAEDR